MKTNQIKNSTAAKSKVTKAPTVLTPSPSAASEDNTTNPQSAPPPDECRIYLLKERGQEKNPDKTSETQSIPEAGITGTVGTTYDSDGNPASLIP